MGYRTHVEWAIFVQRFTSLPETISKLPLILVVDDDPDDVFLVKRAFLRAGLEHPIQSLSSGLDCIRYLNGDSPYYDRGNFPFPALVLLDMKMPLVDGFEVLRWIRHQSKFSRLCVVMLTSSDAIADANLAYKLGADSFLVKPLDFWNAAELSHSVEHMLARH